MTRDEVLQGIRELAAGGALSEQDVMQAYRAGSGTTEPVKEQIERHFNVTKVLYGIGGIVVIAGIVFLIAQMWESFGPGAQIFVTLGSAVALYVAAVLLHTNAQWRSLASLFFVMSAVIMPLGIYVALYNLSTGSDEWLGQLIMAAIPAVVYLISYRLFRQPLLFLVAMLFATWALYAVVGLLLDRADIGYQFEGEIWAYLTFLVGVGYVFVGYGARALDTKKLAGAFYFLGSAGALGGGFALTFLEDFWMFLYFFLILGAFYCSTILRSRAMLFLGALALIAHLIHISFEYFENSLGWPLALIISGFIIIGVGYGTVVLNRKFIKN